MNCTIIRATDFRETNRERAQRESRFRRALLREAIELMLSGDGKTAARQLEEFVNCVTGGIRSDRIRAVSERSDDHAAVVRRPARQIAN
jgi:hypothetical protein